MRSPTLAHKTLAPNIAISLSGQGTDNSSTILSGGIRYGIIDQLEVEANPHAFRLQPSGAYAYPSLGLTAGYTGHAFEMAGARATSSASTARNLDNVNGGELLVGFPIHHPPLDVGPHRHRRVRHARFQGRRDARGALQHRREPHLLRQRRARALPLPADRVALARAARRPRGVRLTTSPKSSRYRSAPRSASRRATTTTRTPTWASASTSRGSSCPARATRSRRTSTRSRCGSAGITTSERVTAGARSRRAP